MYKKSALWGFELKSFSKSSNMQDLSTKGLDKPGKASKLTQGSVGGFIEKITTGGRQLLSFGKKR